MQGDFCGYIICIRYIKNFINIIMGFNYHHYIGEA